MKKIVDFLEELGLMPIEARLYHGLLKIGPTTIKDLADSVHINRVTTHFQINNLINKGLVVQIKKNTRRQIIAEPPEHLQYLIEKKERQIKHLKDDFPLILTNLISTSSYTDSREEVKVKYYEGKDAVRSVYKQVLRAKKIYAFVNVNKIKSVFPENTKLFKKAVDEDPTKQIWDIFETSNGTRKLVIKKNKRHHYCFFPPKVSFSDFDFMVFDNSVAMVYLHTEKPYAIVSDSPTMAAGLKVIHRIVWNVLSGQKRED